MKKIIIGIVIIIIIGIAYWLISPVWRVVHLDETAPIISPATNQGSQEIQKELSGVFVNGAHDVSGTVKIIDAVGGKVLRFENFKTLNGPDLHIYLATDNTAKDYIEVGPIKATEGNINYDLPNDVDLIKYNHVLVWCKAFSVLFGSTEIK